MDTRAPAGDAQDDRTVWDVGTTILNEFLVERHLGRGGFGQVELVQSRRSGQRYAVKRVLLADPVAQSRFLQEALRWINLPEHPHVVPCHFVRTVGHELAVFSEYVDGGSLANWIRTGRLYQGGAAAARARVLDIAIQAAWGLHAAHSMGLLHLDMKPANVLLTDDGVAKVADFGLAGVREQSVDTVVSEEAALDYIAGGPELDAAQREIIKGVLRKQLAATEDERTLVVAAAEGLSVGYAPPEQVERGALTRAADVWSWGVTVLEMFVGERTWPSGTLAAAVLDSLGQQPPTTVALTMPSGVVDLLKACFQDDPAARPPTLSDVASRLSDLFQDVCGHPLGRERPPDTSITDIMQVHYDRRLDTGADWSDPRGWLQFAYQAAGRDERQAVAYWPSGVGTRRARALEDLRALTEAQRVLESTLSTESVELRTALADLRTELAHVRRSLGDASGAIQEYEASVRVLEDMPGERDRLRLSSVLVSLAILLRVEGREDDAVAACDRAIELCRGVEGDAIASLIVGNALLAKGNATADLTARLALYDEAQASYENAGDEGAIVRVLASKASALDILGRKEEAAAVWELAETSLQRLEDAGGSDLLGLKATTLMNRATAASSVREQLRYAEAAVEVYARLVNELGRQEFAGDLGNALFAAGRGYEHADQLQAAVKAYREARGLLEDAVIRDGRFDLTDELATCYEYEGTLVRNLGDPAGAVAVAMRAVEMWQRLADLEGEAAWGPNLATAREKLAASLGSAGNLEAALAEVEEAIRLLQPGDDSTGAGRHRLARAYSERAKVLRKSGQTGAAIEDYQTALDLLADGSQPEEIATRALVLQNLSNAIDDAGDHEAGLQVIEAAIELWETLVDQGEQRRSSLIDAYHNRVNKLVKLGDYEAAREHGTRTLALYRQLVDQEGRSDLIADMARLQAAHGVTLERLLDFEGAISALLTARGLYERTTSLEPEQRDMLLGALEGMRTRLEAVVESGPKDVATWLEEANRKLEQAGSLSRAGYPDEACMSLEEAVGWLMWLLGRYPSDDLYELCGRAATALGVVAMYAHRTEAARRGFTAALSCYGTLVDQGRLDQLDGWAGAELGLASLLLMHGDATQAMAVLDTMKRRLRELDPARHAHWSARAEELLASMQEPSGPMRPFGE